MRELMGKFLRSICLACFWLAVSAPGVKGGGVETPASFFTNVAERLLRSQFDLSLSRIQVYPTNQYTPAVHRLLQVAANLYDASTHSSDPVTGLAFPSVFRPLFACDGANVTICGYTNDNDPVTAKNWFGASPEGIPMVVGAKKGLPNFNEFIFQTAVQFTRKLEVGRPLTNSLPNQTNQLLLLSISNLF